MLRTYIALTRNGAVQHVRTPKDAQFNRGYRIYYEYTAKKMSEMGNNTDIHAHCIERCHEMNEMNVSERTKNQSAYSQSNFANSELSCAQDTQQRQYAA